MGVTLGLLTEKVRLWQSRLDLDHWDIEVTQASIEEMASPEEFKPINGRELVDVEIQGRCDPHSTYNWATLTFDKAMQASPELDQRIIHELLHCLDRDRDEAIRAPLRLLGPLMVMGYEERIDNEEEAHIQALTRIIYNAYK